MDMIPLVIVHLCFMHMSFQMYEKYNDKISFDGVKVLYRVMN